MISCRAAGVTLVSHLSFLPHHASPLHNTHNQAHMASPPSQAFRVGSSSVILINARLNRRTGQYFILWTDIRRSFGNAKRVQDGPTVLSFMVDEVTFEE